MLDPLYTLELAIAPSFSPNQCAVFSIHTASAPDPALCTSCLDYGKRSLMALQLLGSKLSAYKHLHAAQLRPADHRPYSALPTPALQSKPPKKLFSPSFPAYSPLVSCKHVYRFKFRKIPCLVIKTHF